MRELLLNECSEHCDLFNEDDKSEVLFQLFRIVAVGGALCQPDDSLDRYASTDDFVQCVTLISSLILSMSRYLILTKTLYKEFVTIYK